MSTVILLTVKPNEMKPIRITKKQLKKIDYPKMEVLKDQKKRKNRMQTLQSAANAKKKGDTNVRIVFESKRRGPFAVHSEVLVSQKDYVMLSGGFVIPTSSIRKVSY